MWFHSADPAPLPTLPQMLGVGLGSVAAVMLLTFLSSSAVWYVRLLCLRNEWNGGAVGLELHRAAGDEAGHGGGGGWGLSWAQQVEA